MATTFRAKLQQYEITNLQGLDKKDKQVEGIGSYGTVYRVTVEGVPRIAKQLHTALVNSEVTYDQKEPLLQKFHQECLLLSRLYHPNIVEFIGVHFGQDKQGTISLVMEQMHTDLDRFLDKSIHPVVPVSIKAAILLDVSFGLLYLHSMQPEPIIHRDLTARNILLTKDLRAKIADLGVSKMLRSLEPVSKAAHTKCPGTQDYMPPEALKQVPRYGIELDIFSFGHLALCVALQEPVQVFDISDYDPEMLFDYIKRHQIHILQRKVWIDSIRSPDACLRELIIGCLKDKPEERPTAKEVSNVMKIVCDRFPKSPSDIAMVWTESETGALEKELPTDLKSIQILKEQVNRISLEKEALIIEKRALEDEKKVEREINRGLNMVYKTVIDEMNEQLEKIQLLQQEVTSTKVKVEQCEESLCREKKDHYNTTASFDEFKETCIGVLVDMSSKLEKTTLETNYYKEVLKEHGLESKIELPQRGRHLELTRKRSKSDASDHQCARQKPDEKVVNDGICIARTHPKLKRTSIASSKELADLRDETSFNTKWGRRNAVRDKNRQSMVKTEEEDTAAFTDSCMDNIL